jgi:hypothetical protein
LRPLIAFLKNAALRDASIVVPTVILAQAWRGPRSARIAMLLHEESVFVEPFSESDAKLAGLLCAVTRTSDAVDAGLVAVAIRRDLDIVTGDVDDVLALVRVARELRVARSTAVVDLARL